MQRYVRGYLACKGEGCGKFRVVVKGLSVSGLAFGLSGPVLFNLYFPLTVKNQS